MKDGRLDELVRQVLTAADPAAAWIAARPLLDAQVGDPRAGEALAFLLARGCFPADEALPLADTLLACHGDHRGVLVRLAGAFPALHDVGSPNGAPPAHPFFAEVASRLMDAEEDVRVLAALAEAARVLGHAWNDVAERSARRLVELEPASWQRSYDLGLFYKLRGRFAEGLAANRRAVELGGDDDSLRWNLGICATGAGDGETALAVWRQMGVRLELGPGGLPRGDFGPVKVRLAQHPLATRSAERDPAGPGAEETIWIERHSPCHGVVRSAVYYDEIGVDYGDVVLFDGAAITHHAVGGQRVPVFPHLATLRRSGYRIYPFTGTQAQPQQIAGLSGALPLDAVTYVHTEQTQWLCATCWIDPGVPHQHQRPAAENVVRGKLCVPPQVSPRDFLVALDAAAGAAMKVLAPELAAEAGLGERARLERRRLALLQRTA